MPTIIRLIIIPALVYVTLPGCSYYFANQNRSIILKDIIYDGMSKQELLDKLGEPYKLDHPTANIELLYYETDWLADKFCLQYTPIRLKFGRVAQWGMQFCQEPALKNDKIELDPFLKQ